MTAKILFRKAIYQLDHADYDKAISNLEQGISTLDTASRYAGPAGFPSTTIKL